MLENLFLIGTIGEGELQLIEASVWHQVAMEGSFMYHLM